MITSLQDEQKQLAGRLHSAEGNTRSLLDQIRDADNELNRAEALRPKYMALQSTRDSLLHLVEVDAGSLYWGESYSRDQAQQQIDALDRRLRDYEYKIASILEKRGQLQRRLQYIHAKINVLNDEIMELQERALELENEYVIEREEKLRQFRPLTMPWSGDKKDERHFRLAVRVAILISVLLGGIVPMIEIPMPDQSVAKEIPKRFAELVVKKKIPPKPKPVQKPNKIKQAQNKPKQHRPRKDVPKPSSRVAKAARKKAERSGILAFKNDFAQLTEIPLESKLGAKAKLVNKGQKGKQRRRQLVASRASTGSSGIDTAGIGRNVNGNRDVGKVAFTHIESGIGDMIDADAPIQSGARPTRSDEEIQIVFDRYKAALYRIYNRELRKNPTLQGKIVLRITIEPDGSVSKCSVESSELKAPKLERKIIARVKKFNFGAKQGVTQITILYPIEFLPAS